jgi:CheY-like chemotaxis protein
MSEIRVLLAEDNLVNQRVVVKMLQKLGHQADVASNGHEAVALARKTHYDVIFMDIMMPELDGFEAARRIRGLESDSTRSLIIALTANAMGSERTRSLEAGMDDFMTKPFMLGTLKEKLMSIPQTADSNDREGPADVAKPVERAHLVDLVDRSVLRSLASMVAEDDAEYMKELLNDYLTDAERLRGEINEAVETANLLSLRQASHSLKSTSAMFGAQKLSNLCSELEQAAIEEDLPAAQVRMNDFDQVLEAVHTSLVQMVETNAFYG